MGAWAVWYQTSRGAGDQGQPHGGQPCLQDQPPIKSPDTGHQGLRWASPLGSTLASCHTLLLSLGLCQERMIRGSLLVPPGLCPTFSPLLT